MCGKRISVLWGISKGVTLIPPLYKGQPNSILINEQGLYQIIFGSELKRAKEFRRWVFRDVLPFIRKTGSYKLPKSLPVVKPPRPELLYGKQLKLINETDLHYAVVRYTRRLYPKAIIIPGLGEYQDTAFRRSDAYRKGYIGGQPDLIITNPMNGYNGFSIELKTPKGTGEIRDNQVAWLKSLSEQRYRTLISNDYTDIVLQIAEYFRVDPTVKHKKEIEKLKRKCNTLKKKLREKEVVWYKPRFSSHKY